MIERFNSDLANTLGNLVNRTVAMLNQYFEGVIPTEALLSAAPDTEFDADLKAVAEATAPRVAELLDAFRVSDAIEVVMDLARRCNKYIDETTPWVLAKDPDARPRLAKVLYNLLCGIRCIGGLLKPFMPETAEKILAYTPDAVACAEEVSFARCAQFGGLQHGATIGAAKPLFVRVNAEAFLAELKAAEEQKAAAAKAAEQPAVEPFAEEIDIDTFFRSDLRVAKVIACEKVKKSSKLLCLQLDDGVSQRQVVSGIAKWYAPEDLIGKKVLLVANLKPVKLCGVESFGMICASDLPDGSCKVMFVDDTVPCGARLH